MTRPLRSVRHRHEARSEAFPWAPVFTGAQIRQAESPLLDAGQGPTLMRRAARGLAQHVLALLAARGGVYGAAVTAVVGSGNNGGDALYALTMLRRRGVAATAVLVSTRTHVEALRSLRSAGGRIVDASPAAAGSGQNAAQPAVPRGTAVLIDAVLGTGARGDFRLPEVSGLREASRSPDCVTVACDVPSGIDADTGGALGEVLPADHTVTFGGIKQGLLTGQGALHSGEIHPVDIGLAPHLPPPAAWTVEEPMGAEPVAGRSPWRHSGQPGELSQPSQPSQPGPDPAPAAGPAAPRALHPPRPVPGDHKYSRGVLHAVAGSEQYPGAAQLTVGAAVAVGSGMVTLRAVDSVCQRLTAVFPEVVASSRRSRESLGRAGAAVVGPGIGKDGFQSRAMYEVLEWAGSEHPVVLDASALNQLHGTDLAEGGLSPNLLLTPHAGELRRLMEHAGREDLLPLLEQDAAGAVRAIADHLQATVLLKGPSTVIAAPEGAEGDVRTGRAPEDAAQTAPAGPQEVAQHAERADAGRGSAEAERDGPAALASGPTVVLRSFAPGLATAGSGDVLAGILGALAAAEPAEPLWRTAALGVVLHAQAAQRIDPAGAGRFGASALLDALG